MKIRLTESELVKFINKVISEQGYGSLIADTPNVSGGSLSVTGSTTTQTGTTDTKEIILFKDQQEQTKVNNQPYTIIDIKKTSDGKIQVNLKGFSVKTDCTRVSKNDNSFDYGNGKYYSKGLLEKVKPNCG